MVGISTAQAISTSDRALINKLISQELVDVEWQVCEAYVHPTLWNGVSAKIKYGFSKLLAEYVAEKRGKNIYRITIYDMMSGKRLAKYSKTFGFKVY
jgi:hypothetical protein